MPKAAPSHTPDDAAAATASDAAAEAKRTAPRTNLFLMATLVVDGAAHSVRVRNLSASGALVESENLPPAGAVIVLRRGTLAAEGELMWRADHRAGLRFARPVDLGKWMPHAGQGQARVDRVIAQTRSELSSRKQAELDPAVERDRLHERIAEELALVARRLEGLGLDLSGDPAMVVRHAARIQEIDVSVLTLVHVGRLLTASDPTEAVRTIGMADLRRRLDRTARL
jgi:hypothetical protein